MGVPLVAADDESIRRFVVTHYRFDPERRERRDVVVAAFDNDEEFISLVESIQSDIDRRTEAGEFVDENEHASCSIREPGHKRADAYGRFVSKSLRRGVTPGPWLNAYELHPTWGTVFSNSIASASRGRSNGKSGPERLPGLLRLRCRHEYLLVTKRG